MAETHADCQWQGLRKTTSGSADTHISVAPGARQQAPHIRKLHRDAALCRRVAGAGEVEKDRTAMPANPRFAIVIKHDDDIVKMIVAPQLFV